MGNINCVRYCDYDGSCAAGKEIDRLKAELASNERAYEIAQEIIIEQQGKICDAPVFDCNLTRLNEPREEITALQRRVRGFAEDAAKLRATIDKALEEAGCHDGSMAEMVRILAAGRGDERAKPKERFTMDDATYAELDSPGAED